MNDMYKDLKLTTPEVEALKAILPGELYRFDTSIKNVQNEIDTRTMRANKVGKMANIREHSQALYNLQTRRTHLADILRQLES